MAPNPVQARSSFVLDHGAPQTEGSTSGHALHPSVLGAPNVYDKPPPTAHNPYQPPFDTHAYKPHPLYDQSAFDQPAQPPPAQQQQQHFDPNASAVAQERMIKRETVYAPPMSHHDVPQSAPYYSIPHRPAYPRPADGYMSHPLTNALPDLSTQHLPLYASSAWPDNYHASTTPLPRRPQMTATLTPIVPPVGLTSGAGSSSSPSQQSSTGSESRSATVDNNVYDLRRSSAQYIGPFPPASATPAPLPSTSVYIPHPQVQAAANGYTLSDAPPSSDSFRP